MCDLEWGDCEEKAAVSEEGSGSNLNADLEEEIEENEVEATVEADSLFEDSFPNPNAVRNRRPPVWMGDYETGEGLSEEDNEAQLSLFADADPIYFEKAVKSEKWRRAIDVEIEAIRKNGTWELTKLPKGGKTIGVKWIYKTKFNENGEVDKHKARLVAKGYT